MRSSKVLLLFAFIIALFTSVGGCRAAENSTALDAYVKAPDASFAWKHVSTQDGEEILELTSQTWQQKKWTHQLTIVRPAREEFPDTALLLINVGGSADDLRILKILANGSGCTVVGLSKVPNQPLWDRNEDALIAHTFAQFLETGDDTWPLLLPMTKSVIKAMDAVQEYTKSTSAPITKFIVGGASKRGWTTWLVGAQDQRVIGIVPMVYDNLNLPQQLPHQKEMLGDYSSEIGDYTRLNLPAQLMTPQGQKLVQMVDPYTYRDRITMPKLIINGANDPFWTVDSLNLYYNDLKGPKDVFYIPNAGHSMNLDKGIAGALYVLGTVQNWTRLVAAGKTPPAVQLNVAQVADGKKFTASVPGGSSAELWVAKSTTKDFRKSTWEATPMQQVGDHFEAEIKTPESGYIAVFAQLTTEGSTALPFRLSTPMTWWGAQ